MSRVEREAHVNDGAGVRLFDQTLEHWPTVKKRWEAFWQHGLYDRRCYR